MQPPVHARWQCRTFGTEGQGRRVVDQMLQKTFVPHWNTCGMTMARTPVSGSAGLDIRPYDEGWALEELLLMHELVNQRDY